MAVLLLDLHDDDSRVAFLPGRVAPRWGQAAVGAQTGEERVSVVDVVHAVHIVHTVAVVVPDRERGTDHYAVERHRVTIAATAAAAAFAAEADLKAVARVVPRADAIAALTRAAESAQAASEVGAEQTVDEEVTAGLHVEAGGRESLEQRAPLGRRGGRAIAECSRDCDPQAEQVVHEERRFREHEEDDREEREERSAFEERSALPVPPAHRLRTRGLQAFGRVHRRSSLRARCRRRRALLPIALEEARATQRVHQQQRAHQRHENGHDLSGARVEHLVGDGEGEALRPGTRSPNDGCFELPGRCP